MVNSRVLSTQFRNGREQGLPGYPIWKWSDILNHNILHKLELPNTWGDLCMPIGIFGFYSHFLTLYDLDIRPWRYICVKSKG